MIKLIVDGKNGGTYMKKERLYLLDTIRGILIIGVVIYHLLYDLNSIFGMNILWLNDWWADFIRDFGAGSFIFISGMACHLSRNNTKRGIKAIVVALVISIVTYVIIPEEFILFGIIHFLGICMIMYDGVGKYFNKMPLIFGSLMFLVFFILTYNVYYGYIGIKGFFEINLPSALYGNVVGFIMGFGKGTNIYSADYYPIFPWIFLFISGIIVGNYFEKDNVNKIFYKNYVPAISWIGSKTMIIYILHQPIMYGILNIIF